MAERIEFKPGKDDQERAYNLEAMAHGVVGMTCILVARLVGTSSPYIDFLREGERFSSVEVYASGAMNLFIRNAKDVLVAFVRVRPEG